MNIHDIDPYLRFVNTIRFKPMQGYSRAADSHFYYMHEDSCPIYIDGVKYEPGHGSVIIIPAGTEYSFKYDGALEFVSINFDYTQSCCHITKERPPVASEKFCESDITERYDFEDYTFLSKPIVLNNMGYLRPSVDVILEEYKYKKKFYREVSSSLFKNILMEVMRNILWEAKNSDTLNRILDYIHTHYDEDIDNSILARLAGYHPYHLNRLMKNATGITLHKYLTNYRMAVAKRYLTENELQVIDIAERCGYKNISNFSSDFKSKTGLSPTKYRSQLRNMI